MASDSPKVTQLGSKHAPLWPRHQGSIFPKSRCAWRSLEGAGWGEGILGLPEGGITAGRKLAVRDDLYSAVTLSLLS